MTSISSQQICEDSLTKMLASTARLVVLRLFLLDPKRAYYQRQIEAVTGLPIRAVQRELERLSSAGLLYRRSEGNRTYCQVDIQHPLYPELRSMILKAADAEDTIRGLAATDESVRLAFLSGAEERVLVITNGAKRPGFTTPPPYVLEVMTSDEFEATLADRRERLDPFLEWGVDLLGRRDDVIWRRIEAAGYTVNKGKGVA